MLFQHCEDDHRGDVIVLEVYIN